MYLPLSYKYDPSGRKRKPRKPKGEVCVKYVPPKFQEYQPSPSYASQRAAETRTATNRHLLLQQRQEETNENHQAVHRRLRHWNRTATQIQRCPSNQSQVRP